VQTVAEKITITLERNSEGEQMIVMMFGETKYIMLTVKKSIMAAKIVEALDTEFHVKALIGMAFDYKLSVGQRELVYFSDPTVVGIYIPFSDLLGEVSKMLGK